MNEYQKLLAKVMTVIATLELIRDLAIVEFSADEKSETIRLKVWNDQNSQTVTLTIKAKIFTLKCGGRDAEEFNFGQLDRALQYFFEDLF